MYLSSTVDSSLLETKHLLNLIIHFNRAPITFLTEKMKENENWKLLLYLK